MYSELVNAAFRVGGTFHASGVLIIVPAYNEAKSVGSVVRDVLELHPEFTVLVVDDGSIDSTAEVAAAAGAVVARLPVNLGIGGAVQTGYCFAMDRGYSVAIQVDGDGQHLAEEIGVLLQPIRDGTHDMVVGTRFLGEGTYKAPLMRRLGIYLFAGIVSLITRQRVTDTTSGFRAVNRRGIRLFAADYPQDYPEVETGALIHRHGLRACEVPVQMRARETGSSSITPIRSAYYVVKVSLALLVGLFRKPIRVPDPLGEDLS